MPSGARKRKAAKKKKELEANNNHSSHDHDDAKSQDDKGSDGGGEVGDPSSVRPLASEERDGSVIQIQWSLKPDDGSSTSSRSRSRSRSSSSGSSSDDESHAAAEKKQPDQEVTENVSPEPENLVAELSPVIQTVTPVAPVSEETINVLEFAPVENQLVHEVIKSDTGVVEKYEDNKVVVSSDEDSKASSSELKSGSKEYKDSKTLASPENQAPVAPVANSVQKTSVFSCCGIFDLFSGSSR